MQSMLAEHRQVCAMSVCPRALGSRTWCLQPPLGSSLQLNRTSRLLPFKPLARATGLCNTPLRQSLPALRRGIVAAASATTGNAYPDDASTFSKDLVHDWRQQLSRWFQRLIAAAVVCLAAFIGMARHAEARIDSGASAGASAPETAACMDGRAPRRGFSETGIQLAANPEQQDQEAGNQLPRGEWRDPAEVARETRIAINKVADDKLSRRMARLSKESKGGKRVVDPTKSVVPDPSSIPPTEQIMNRGIMTVWRADKLKDLTYTQFLALVKEGRVDKVRFTEDRRSVVVTTKASAPGGVRTQKVPLPFDPDLFDTLVEHGVFIESYEINPILPVLHSLARLVFPIAFSILLIKFAFRLGRKKKRDKIFGGAKLQSMQGKDSSVTFKDIAGVEQVKNEIMEIVEFLRNPKRFLELGAKTPAGVLLVGPPGTGKTLMARAIAGEANVPFFSVAGTEFMEVFVGVGASRVRDMFAQARKNAPCILFIDEFDGLGKARTAAGNDESVHTINQLLTEMDGFEDNTGVVIMAATNRPAALDQALTRPGRFDRIVHLPLPNVDGREAILKVHARGKRVDPHIAYDKIARATAGYTGAEIMHLMNQSAIIAVRQQQRMITEPTVFEALEKISRERIGNDQDMNADVSVNSVPPVMRRTIAVYEAGRALMGYITPDYDEVQRVSVCPQGLATGYTYFLPREETIESRIVSRGYMEARMVVALAGRCAEKLLLGEANVSTAGANDLEQANVIAREMVYRCGFSRRLGPVTLMDDEESYINKMDSSCVADVSTELAKIAFADIEELVEAAEAKAYYGLASNYAALERLVGALEHEESMTGKELGQLLEEAGVKKFKSMDSDGFGWGPDGGLMWPGKPETTPEQRQLVAAAGPSPDSAPSSNGAGNGSAASPSWWYSKNPYRVRTDVPNFLDLR